MLDEETLKILTCPKCKQLSKEPMECQSCQQLYCTECQPPVCLLCKKQSAFRFSKVAKKIIGDIDIKCPHCSLTVKQGDLEDVHFKSCSKYLIKCKYSACNFEGNKTDFTYHILSNHVAEVLDIFTNPLVEDIEKLGLFNSKKEKLKLLGKGVFEQKFVIKMAFKKFLSHLVGTLVSSLIVKKFFIALVSHANRN